MEKHRCGDQWYGGEAAETREQMTGLGLALRQLHLAPEAGPVCGLSIEEMEVEPWGKSVQYHE